MRREALAQLHDSHQGTVRTKDRARFTVYWPGMDKEIDNTILSCKLCQDSLPLQQKEPITLKPTLQRPFQEIAADFCSHAGQQYLITVDCFSDWPEITPTMTKTTTKKLVSPLKCHFVALVPQTKYGLTKAHSSHPRPSKSSQNNGASNTLPHHQGILKATERPKLQ